MPVAIEKVTVYIEKKPYKVKPHQSMLQACLSLGFDVPFFAGIPPWVPSAPAASVRSSYIQVSGTREAGW